MATNQVNTWVDPALEPVEYLRADFRDFAFPSHLHETYAIGIIERGVQKFRTRRGSSEMMCEGTLCVINPGEVHDGRSGVDGGWKYRMFYPSERLVKRVLQDDIGTPENVSPTFDAHVLTDSDLYRRFLALHDASNSNGTLLERESRTIVFLRELFSRHASSRASNEPVHNARTAGLVREILHARFAERVSIGELAVEAAVSETQVIRSFTDQFGMAPHAYVIALRVEYAKRLIRSGNSLAEVASETGFFDQSHLHRHFKRFTGVTPGAFARGSQAR